MDQLEHEWLAPKLHWSPNGERFAYEQADGGHQRLRAIEVETRTAKVLNLVEERSCTFLWTAHTEHPRLRPIAWLAQTAQPPSGPLRRREYRGARVMSYHRQHLGLYGHHLEGTQGPCA